MYKQILGLKSAAFNFPLEPLDFPIQFLPIEE